MTSPLRDLAAQIEDLARRHPAYSQAWQPVRNLSDHLCALARCEEANNNIKFAFRVCQCKDWETADRRTCLKWGQYICRSWVRDQLKQPTTIEPLR